MLISCNASVDFHLKKASTYSTALCSAAGAGATDACCRLIELNANLEHCDSSFGTPLHQAVVSAHYDTAKALLELKASPNDTSGRKSHIMKRSALFHATQRGSRPLVELLVKHKALLDQKEATKCLVGAADNGHTALCLFLIEHKAQVNGKAEQWWARRGPVSALEAAVHASRLECARALVDVAHARIDSSLLGYAMLRCTSIEMCRFVLKRKPSCVKKKQTHGWSALVSCIASASATFATNGSRVSLETLRMLLDAKASSRSAALIYAAARGLVKHVRMLLIAKANPNKRDAMRRTALFQAARHGHKDLVDLLLSARANPNLSSTKLGSTHTLRGGSPLVAAASRGHISICKALLAGKARVDMQDNSGGQALLRAAEYGYDEQFLLLLLRARANVNAVTLTGRTPLMAVARSSKSYCTWKRAHCLF
jgi:ankyrin repeat protein